MIDLTLANGDDDDDEKDDNHNNAFVAMEGFWVISWIDEEEI